MFAKVFYARQHEPLVEKVQKWLDETPKASVTHLSISSNNYGHTVTLIVDDAAAPQHYRFQLVHGKELSGHHEQDKVEGELNSLLTTAKHLQLIAQSSNEWGIVVALLLQNEADA